MLVLESSTVSCLHQAQRPDLGVLERFGDLIAFPYFVLNTSHVATDSLEEELPVFFGKALKRKVSEVRGETDALLLLTVARIGESGSHQMTKSPQKTVNPPSAMNNTVSSPGLASQKLTH